MIQFLPRTSVPVPDVGKRRLFLDAADNLLKWKLRDGSIEAISASGGIPSGTSFPGSPASGDIFLRTDRQIIYFYDGTRWLSQQIYTQQIPQSDALLPRNATSTDTGRTLNFWNGQYDMYVLDFVVIYFLTAASTVNFKLTKTDAATNTTMVTSANQTTSGSYTCVRTAVNAVVANTVEQFTNTITFVSGAAGCYPSAGITYRLIG